MKVDFEFFDKSNLPQDGSSVLVNMEGENSADDLYPATFQEGRFYLDMGSNGEDITDKVERWTYDSILGVNESQNLESFYVLGREDKGGSSIYLCESKEGWDLTKDWEAAFRFATEAIEMDDTSRALAFKSPGEEEIHITNVYIKERNLRFMFCEA